MNSVLAMSYVDSLPTLVQSDKNYIRMLIEQAVARMPPPLTEEEEQARKADDEAREKARVEFAREEDARRAEIAVKEAERDKELADAAAKTAADNLAAAKATS